MTARTPWKTAWITGASSGIGRELTLKLATQGVRVAASARSADKLAELEKLNPNIIAIPADVTDRLAMERAAATAREKLGSIDLAILNAGVWRKMTAKEYRAQEAADVMNTNFVGVANGIGAALPDMIGRKQGHIGIVASVAGIVGLPFATTYGPSKAALINLAECLQHDLYDVNVKISVICPGYIETPMTSINEFPMPYIMPVSDAADRIIAGLAKGKFEIAFPWQVQRFLKLGKRLPHRLFAWYVRNFM